MKKSEKKTRKLRPCEQENTIGQNRYLITGVLLPHWHLDVSNENIHRSNPIFPF